MHQRPPNLSNVLLFVPSLTIVVTNSCSLEHKYMRLLTDWYPALSYLFLPMCCTENTLETVVLFETGIDWGKGPSIFKY